LGVKDGDLAQFLKCNTESHKSGHKFDTVEITENEANLLGSKWTKQIERRDDNVIIPILAKIGRGETLTQKEKDALNPDSKEPGITKTPTFSETLNETLKK
jgi:hypothetical protein